MTDVPARIQALKRGRDLAGGVSFLARRIGVDVHALDAMIHGHADIPARVFIAVVDFIRTAELGKPVPEGFPADWEADVRHLDPSRP